MNFSIFNSQTNLTISVFYILSLTTSFFSQFTILFILFSSFIHLNLNSFYVSSFYVLNIMHLFILSFQVNVSLLILLSFSSIIFFIRGPIICAFLYRFFTLFLYYLVVRISSIKFLSILLLIVDRLFVSSFYELPFYAVFISQAIFYELLNLKMYYNVKLINENLFQILMDHIFCILQPFILT